MEHPDVDIIEIKKMSLEQIQEKLSELYKRQAFAYRVNNIPLLNQINMVVEVYARAQTELLDEMFSPGDGGPDLAGKIDVS